MHLHCPACNQLIQPVGPTVIYVPRNGRVRLDTVLVCQHCAVVSEIDRGQDYGLVEYYGLQMANMYADYPCHHYKIHSRSFCPPGKLTRGES